MDDNVRDLMALQSVLEPLGHEIVTAPSGERALELVTARDFATILLDVRMSGLDGFETVARLTELGRVRATPIILVSGAFDSHELIRRGYAVGAVDYIAKPVDPDLLRLKVAAFVLLYQRGQELERKALAVALAREQTARADAARRQAEEAKGLRDRFIAILGHDLRNPLSVISIAAVKVKAFPGGRDFGERIARAVARMESIIKAVVDFAHGHFTGEIPISPAPQNLAEICRTVVSDFENAESQRPIALEIEDSLPGVFDRSRLEQVLSNLLGNALEHGSGSVTVAAGEQSGQLWVSVHNRGSPIPPDQLSTIFEPFRKANGSNGLGLGLFIVRQVMRAHGGTVEARSSAAEGTTFVCRWPALRGPEAAVSGNSGLSPTPIEPPLTP